MASTHCIPTSQRPAMPVSELRFVPAGVVPITVYLTDDDFVRLQGRAESGDVRALVAGHVRKLLKRKGGAA